MPDLITGGTVDKAIGTALNGLSTRQRVISNNLANVDTPGFKASTVSFEEQLQRALDPDKRSPLRLTSTDAKHLGNTPSDPGMVGPAVQRDDAAVIRNDGNSVDIDKEMVQLADTAISYSALVQVATARLSLARYIVNEGRR